MLFESNFFQVLMLALLTVLIFTVAYKFLVGVKTGEVDKAIQNLKISIFATGFICTVLWFLLPITPAFSSFGPQTISDIQSNEALLTYLQNYHQAIDRTAKVLYFFLFFFVWGFLSSIYYVSKVANNLRETVNLSNTEEKTFN